MTTRDGALVPVPIPWFPCLACDDACNSGEVCLYISEDLFWSDGKHAADATEDHEPGWYCKACLEMMLVEDLGPSLKESLMDRGLCWWSQGDKECR